MSALVELTPRQEELVTRLVGLVDRAGLHTPAILALEMGRPLNRVASVALLVASPSVSALFGTDALDELAPVLEQRQSVEYIIQRIEAVA